MRIVILFIFISNIVFSQQEIYQDIRVDHGNALLWKISENGLKKPSYLFGTMHLIEKDNFLFPKKLQRKIKGSKSLIMELEGTPDPKEAMALLMLENGTFFDFFTEKQTDSILKWANDNFKMNETMFRMSFTKLKPFVVMQLATQLYFQGKTESYEMSFEKIAKKNNLTTLGLETMEEQLGLFDNLKKEQQAEMLMESIRNQEENITLTKEMQTLYFNQDLHALYEMVTQSGGIISEEQNRFLDDRNKKWVPIITEEISKNKTFIAVGAGHLDGQNGVIQLLINQGYTLTPIQL